MAYTKGTINYPYHETDNRWLPASWRGVQPTDYDNASTSVNIFTDDVDEADKCEIGIFEANMLALSVPHSIVPSNYLTQMRIDMRMNRRPPNVHSIEDMLYKNAMIFTFKPLILHMTSVKSAPEAYFSKTTDGQIVAYVKNLQCKIVKRIYDRNSDHEVEKTDRRYTGTQNKAFISHQSGNYVGNSNQGGYDYSLPCDSSSSTSVSLYNDIIITLHDVVFVQRTDYATTAPQGSSTFYEGFKVRDVKGITVTKKSTVDYIQDTILYDDKDIKFNVPRDTLADNTTETAIHDGKVANRIDYDWFVQQQPAADAGLFNLSNISNMLYAVEITDQIDDSTVLTYADFKIHTSNTINGNVEDNHLTVTTNNAQTGIFSLGFTDANDDETYIHVRPNTTNLRVDQLFVACSLFGGIEYDYVGQSNTQIHLHFDMYVLDYYHLNGARTYSDSTSVTSSERHAIRGNIQSGRIQINTGLPTIPVTYDELNVDNVVAYYYFLLVPYEVTEIYTCAPYNLSSTYFRFTRKSSTVTKTHDLPDVLGSFTTDDVKVALKMYEMLSNNKTNKDRYITPMEYYSTSKGGDVALFNDDQLKSTAATNTDIPVYFWVETLKNWCTFTYQTLNETSCTEAQLNVWNGLNGWYPLGNLLDFSKNYYVTPEILNNLDPSKPEDQDKFAKFLMYTSYKLSMYNFPLEKMHTINIDRVYRPFDPNLAGQKRSIWESIGHGFMTGIRAIGSGFNAVWDCAKAVVNVVTLDFGGAWDSLTDTWSDLWDMWSGIYTAVLIMPIQYIGEHIIEAIMGSNANSAMYDIDFGKRLFARCFYVKLPYDSGYSSNDKNTYQTVRVQHRAEKAYGPIDGGVIHRVTCAALNVIPTTIGSPFMVRSSSGELMIAYDMMYSGPIREEADPHSDLLKISGIAPIDIELSNQLLCATLGSGEDKTIDDWLNVFGESDEIVSSSISDISTTNLSSKVVEQDNIIAKAQGKLTIKSNRSKVSSDVENVTINTLHKW